MDFPDVLTNQSVLSAEPGLPESDALAVVPLQKPRSYLDQLAMPGTIYAEIISSSPDQSQENATAVAVPTPGPMNSSSLRTGYCYDPRMRNHVEIMSDNDDFHPEDPRRIYEIFKMLCRSGLVVYENFELYPGVSMHSNPMQEIKSRYATKEECCLVHDEEHFDALKATAELDDYTLFTMSKDGESVYFSQSTYSAAGLAAGSAIDISLAVVRKEIKNGIAIIRPPGHHAEPHRSRGFCHFDNVSVAIRNVQKLEPSVKKVLIVDWDVHHGNGIQNAFWEDPNVLYISLHCYMGGDFYPYKGPSNFTDDGGGPGKGKNINIPWDAQQRTDGDYLAAFQHIIMPVAHEFGPDLVMVASGFDAAEGDSLGQCHVTPAGYSQMTHMLMSLANGKVVVCLEGGYNLNSISISALAVAKTLMGEAPTAVKDAIPTPSGSRTIFQTIRHHQQHWKSLVPKDNLQNLEGVKNAIRLHDVIRSGHAELLFRAYKMFPLPIYRTTPKGNRVSRSFDNQVLASPDFRKANELLIIFHDQPQLEAAAPDPITGNISLSAPQVVDHAAPYIEWAASRNLGIIDVNLPDWYTGISKEARIGDTRGEAKAKEDNKREANAQMQIVSTHIWDNYVANSAAKKVVMLGLGNAFCAIQRIIATHPLEAFERQPIKAVGIINDEVPGAYNDPSLQSFEHYYRRWTTIWVSHGHAIFGETKDGRPKKKYGNVVQSEYRDLNSMLTYHDREIRSAILNHFERSADPSSAEPSDDEEVQEQERSGSDSSSRSILGKRARENGVDEGRDSARARLSEEES